MSSIFSELLPSAGQWGPQIHLWRLWVTAFAQGFAGGS